VRRLIALAVPIVLTAAVAPAGATPAQLSRIATARLEVPVAGGDVLRLELRGSARTTGDLLMVAVTRCGARCDSPRYYSGALPAGALTIDAKAANARLSAVVGGLPVSVAWSPAEGTTGVVIGGVNGGGGAESAAFRTYRGDPAVVSVTSRAGGCTGAGSVGDELELATSARPNPTVEPLTRLRLRPTSGLACSGAGSEWPGSGGG
jgi:hypothetical protein